MRTFPFQAHCKGAGSTPGVCHSPWLGTLVSYFHISYNVLWGRSLCCCPHWGHAALPIPSLSSPSTEMKGNIKPNHSSRNLYLKNTCDISATCAWEDHSFKSSTVWSKLARWPMKWFFVFRKDLPGQVEGGGRLLTWLVCYPGVSITQSPAGQQAELALSMEQNKALGETFIFLRLCQHFQLFQL